MKILKTGIYSFSTTKMRKVQDKITGVRIPCSFCNSWQKSNAVFNRPRTKKEPSVESSLFENVTRMFLRRSATGQTSNFCWNHSPSGRVEHAGLVAQFGSRHELCRRECRRRNLGKRVTIGTSTNSPHLFRTQGTKVLLTTPSCQSHNPRH